MCPCTFPVRFKPQALPLYPATLYPLSLPHALRLRARSSSQTLDTGPCPTSETRPTLTQQRPAFFEVRLTRLGVLPELPAVYKCSKLLTEDLSISSFMKPDKAGATPLVLMAHANGRKPPRGIVTIEASGWSNRPQ